jgi:hypothetical protein
MEAVLQFLYGGLCVMCLAVGLFFLRYWSLQRDRFFVWFTVAFWAFGASWGVHLVYASTETGPHVYLFRLVGFLLIIVAIIEKNRQRSPDS